MKKFSINVAGQRVDGTFFVPDNENKNPGVIFFHGAESSEKRYIGMAEQLIKMELQLWPLICVGMVVQARGLQFR